MTLLDTMLYNPTSFFEGKKWWQILLWVLPWVLLFVGASVLWFLAPARLTAGMIKNTPLDAVNKVAEKQLSELEKQLQELHKRSTVISTRIEEKAREFDVLEKSIQTKTHEELKKQLEGGEL